MPKLPSVTPNTVARTAQVDAATPTPKVEDAQAPKPAGQAATFGGAGSLTPGDVQAEGTPGAAIAAQLEAMGFSEQDTAGMRPGVAELHAKYGVASAMGRPRERILTWTALIDERLQGFDTPEALTTNIIEKDLRRQIFLLEGITKLYKNTLYLSLNNLYH